MRKHLKEMGFKWKFLKADQAYVNRQKNILSREVFAKRVITLMENRKILVFIDETGFNSTHIARKAWVEKNVEKKVVEKKFLNITAITAVTEEGF